MLSRHMFARDFWAFGDVASDDTESGGEGLSDQPDCHQIDRLVILQSNSYLQEFYKDVYQAIYRCNVAIAYIPQGQFDPALKSRLIAEARFLRAMYYFYLDIVYGGVRIVDHPLQPSEYKGPRNTLTEVLHFVEDEFKTAADSLPVTYDAANAGRATKGAALSYLLKALVFESSYAQLKSSGKDNSDYFNDCQSKWSEAKQVFEEIRGLNVYSLDPNTVDSDFMDSRLNMKGVVLKGQYNFKDNVALNVAYGHATRKNDTLAATYSAGNDIGLNLNSFDLFQLDLTYKF